MLVLQAALKQLREQDRVDRMSSPGDTRASRAFAWAQGAVHSGFISEHDVMEKMMISNDDNVSAWGRNDY